MSGGCDERSKGVALLQARENCEVVLKFRDGECARVRVLHVAPEEAEVVYDIISTDRPLKYPPEQLSSAHLARISEIAQIDDECINPDIC